MDDNPHGSLSMQFLLQHTSKINVYGLKMPTNQKFVYIPNIRFLLGNLEQNILNFSALESYEVYFSEVKAKLSAQCTVLCALDCLEMALKCSSITIEGA